MIARAEPECLCFKLDVPSSFTMTISEGEHSYQDDVFIGTTKEVAARIAEIVAKGIAEMEARGKS